MDSPKQFFIEFRNIYKNPNSLPLLAGRLSKSETETFVPVVKFVAGEDEDGDNGGTKELKFLTFLGALGLYRSFGCVSKAALTIVELADRIAIFEKLSAFFFLVSLL